MGRTLKRVPMAFNWPLNKVWEGYLNPHYGKRCSTCGGHGQNEATHQIDEEWYALDNPRWVSLEGRSRRYNDNAHQYHLTQVEVDALLAGNRLHDLKNNLRRDPTVEEVNNWAIHALFGHDSINRWICCRSKGKRSRRIRPLFNLQWERIGMGLLRR